MTISTAAANLPAAGDDQPAPTKRVLDLRLLGLDQAIYSASNFGLAALGGRSLAQGDFGRFAFVILAISVFVNLGKAIWHEPDLATGKTRLTPRPIVLMGIAAGALALCGAAFAFGFASLPLMALLGVVAAVAQDRSRYHALAANRLRPVIAGDAMWLLVIVAALILEVRFERPDQIIGVWILGAVVGLLPPALAGLRSAATGETPIVGLSQRQTLLVDFMLFSGMTQVGGLAVGLVLPIEAFASVRGAIIIFGPIGILTGALTTWIFGSLDQSSPDVGVVSKRAVQLGLLSAAMTGLLVMVPASLGRSLLGSGWPPTWVLLGIGVAVALQAISTPGMMLLRLGKSHRVLLQLRLIAFASFVSVVLGVALISQSAIATAAAYGAVNGLLAIGVWTHLRRQFT